MLNGRCLRTGRGRLHCLQQCHFHSKFMVKSLLVIENSSTAPTLGSDLAPHFPHPLSKSRAPAAAEQQFSTGELFCWIQHGHGNCGSSQSEKTRCLLLRPFAVAADCRHPRCGVVGHVQVHLLPDRKLTRTATARPAGVAAEREVTTGGKKNRARITRRTPRPNRSQQSDAANYCQFGAPFRVFSHFHPPRCRLHRMPCNLVSMRFSEENRRWVGRDSNSQPTP